MTLELGDVTAFRPGIVYLRFGIGLGWQPGLGFGLGLGLGLGLAQIRIVKYMQGKSHDSRDVAHIWAP